MKRSGFTSASNSQNRFEDSLREDRERREQRKAERRGAKRGKRVPPRAVSRSPLKRKGFTPASKAQKEKVTREGARIKDSLIGPGLALNIIDPAHVTPRGMGGCDHEDCIVPLPRRLHRLYDGGELDVLPYLTLEEQAHAVGHLGILGALKRTTGERYVPEKALAE